MSNLFATEVRQDYEAEFPTSAIVAGRRYWSTGKTGKRIKCGTPVGELEAGDYSRIWIDAAGNVYPE